MATKLTEEYKNIQNPLTPQVKTDKVIQLVILSLIK